VIVDNGKAPVNYCAAPENITTLSTAEIGGGGGGGGGVLKKKKKRRKKKKNSVMSSRRAIEESGKKGEGEGERENLI